MHSLPLTRFLHSRISSVISVAAARWPERRRRAAGLCSTIRKLWCFFCRNGHELEDSEGAAHFQLSDVAVQPIEDAGVVAADKEDLVALQFQVAIEGAGQQLNGGDEGSRETVG